MSLKHDEYWRKKTMEANVKHGMYNTRIYRIWASMKQRCNNINSCGYERYGGRGISICEEWNDKEGFINFYNWSMENGYSEELTIDRINNDGNYEPDNCRWVDYYTQLNNFSRNVKITFNGETHSLSEWGRIKPNGLNYNTLRSRLREGWDIEKAFTEPKHTKVKDAEGNLITINGETHNVKHWCNLTGIDKCTFYRRIQRGWSIERAATEPQHSRHVSKKHSA